MRPLLRNVACLFLVAGTLALLTGAVDSRNVPPKVRPNPIPRSAPAVPEPRIEVYFSPDGGCTDAVVREVGKARKTVRMQAYFEGELDAFRGLEVRTGGTAFQSAAWLALRGIPAGRTATYREQAARVGRPAAVRAIGAANGQNPLAIVLPCHRVVGSNGALTGYAGGLATKQWLLAHEARHARNPVPEPA
jgi:O-6-methylguanine DNA methyltransferase